MADPNRTLLDRADIGNIVPSMTHASRHAAAGGDFIPPESIQALANPLLRSGAPSGQMTNNGVLGQSFDVDLFTDPGMWWVSGQVTPENGFPWTPHSFGILINEWASNQDYMRQTIQTSQDGRLACLWTRISRAGTWGSWEPIKVDTGLRVLADSDLLNGWINSNTSSGLSIRRSENLVIINGQITGGGTATDAQLWTVPSGFRPPRYQSGTGTSSTSGGSRFLTSGGGPLTLPDAVGSNGHWSVSMSYFTDDPWPTILPGTPA